jgi:biofilm protein TabA
MIVAYFVNTSRLLLSDFINDKVILAFVKNCIEKAKSIEKNSFELIRYDENIFAILQNTILKNRGECNFESHKKYIDIHIVVDGVECIELLDLKHMEKSFEANLEKDYFLYKSTSNPVMHHLDRNKIAIFLFDDVHKVGVHSLKSSPTIIKVVLKVKKDIFDMEFKYEY